MNPPEQPSNEPHTPRRLNIQDGPRLSVELSSPTSPGLRRSSFTNHIKPTPRSRAPQDVRDRSRIGYQNMIMQSFQELQARLMPLPIFESLKIQVDETNENVFGAIVESVKGVVKLKEGLDSSQKARAFDEEQDDATDGGEHGFDTKQTHHLLSNLWTIIKQSDDSGAYVFDDGPQSQDRSSIDQKFASSFRRSRHSLSPSGRRSRSPSPAFASNSAQGSELLTECISMLSSIILEDCRFKYRPISLTHPPNALQALVLLITRFLVFKHRHDPKTVYLLLVALTPAFSTFGKEMHLRLLSFFEEVVVIILEIMDQSVDAKEQKKADANIVVTGDQHPSVSIQVESFDGDDAKPAMRWTPWGSQSSRPYTVLSTNAPSHQLSVYYSSSALVNLFTSIISTIGTSQDSETRPEVLHRLHHIVDLVCRMKHDLYTDLLEVVASQPSRARYAAVSFLTTLWPTAVGHSSLSCPFPVTSYPPASPRVSPYDHQFVPWCFRAISSQHLPNLSQTDCRSCSKPIREFGLYCPYCLCAVHFGCYDHPSGCHLSQHHSADNSNVQRIAMYRFSDLLPPRRDKEPMTILVKGHAFRLTNLFTLSLCAFCRKPLWGNFAQCFRCITCTTLVHDKCLQNHRNNPEGLSSCSRADFTSDSLEIPWTDLRQSCVDHYDDLLKTTRDHLSEKTYEELDVFLAMLFIQKQILDNGVAMGSIVIRQRGKLVAQQDAPILDSFELHHVIAWCEDLISSRNGDISPGMDEYFADNGVHPTQFLITSEWTSLLYIASVIKAPRSTHKAVSRDTLNVPILSDSSSDDDSTHPNEVVTLSQLRDILGYDFHLFSDYAAKHVLSLLHHLGFFYESRLNPDIFSGDPQETYCIFPLPLGLDLSTNVELLFSSIEASLSDLDLSVNEFGFLILTRKLWPDGLLSDYAHRRLCKGVLCWILAEDVSLAAILRDFLAKQKPLPGIRSAMDSHPWPYTQDSRPSPSGSANNGGDYIAARRGMLSRYACRWLRALHDQNPPQYAVLLFDLAQEIAEIENITADSSKTGNRVTYDRTLSNIAGFMRASVTFTVGDDLFLFWLESLLPDCIYTEPMPSLLRLLPKEVDSFQRTSVFLDAHPQQDVSTTSIEPWRAVTKTAQENVEGLQRGLKWLHVLVRSGIDVPAPTFGQICDYALNYDTPFEDIHFFIETIFTSLWLRSLGRQSLQRIIARLWSKHASTVWDNLKSAAQLETTMRFIRYSLAANLILYGCERQNIITLGFISQAEVADIPSRRKITTRAEEISDPITIDPEIMEVLDAYIASDIDELSSYVIKFLHAFLAESPLLESYEVDNFVLRNGQVLCRWAWKAYDIQQFDISAIRPAFLLRTLVVDEEPFQSLLDGLYQSSVDWKIRLDSVSRIFRIILETLSASFNVEGRQWRTSVANVFRRFFSAIWSDEKEEVRLEAKSLSRTLLPTHLLAVALCWNEALMKAPMSERVGITSFLIELHSHFPEWQLLSWEVITEILSELNYTEKHGDAEDGPASAHLSMYGIHSKKDDAGSVVGLDDEMSQLRRGVLSLSLRMISDGILVDNQTLMKVKLHLLQALGFDGVSTVTTADGHNFDVRFNEVRVMDAHMYPLVTELVAVLDSHHKFWQTSTVNAPQNGSSYGLVGTVFSDILIRIFSTLDDLTSIPVMVLKGLVEGLGIIIHKQDFEERPMRHLQQPLRKAVHRLHEVLLGEGSYEVRQLALSVTQAFIKKCPTFMGTIIISSVETATKLVSSQGHHGMNDLLVAQARSFLETTLTAYPNGLFISICKREVDDEFFVVIKQLTDAHAKPSTRHLREVLLRDTLMKAIESDRATFQRVLLNLQSYVDVVHHENYTAESMQFVGQCLTHLARRASEWAAESLDTSPLLIIPAKLMQFNKVHSREMFNYTETMLRIILNRLDVKSSSLSQLIRVAATIVKKNHQPNTHSTQTPPNSIVQVVFEILGDGLRLKSRVQPTTIASMLEVITTSEHGIDSLAKTHPLSFLGLVDSGFHFLSHHTWSNERADKDFDASISVAKMVLEAATLDKNIMVRLFEHVTEKRTSLSVRGWNIMVLAAMTEVTGTWEDILFTQLGAFTIAHQTTILGLINAGGPLSQNAKTEVNYAYISMKAWLLLAHKVSLRREVDGATWLAIWSGLWTPFESLVDVIEAENTPGVSTTLSLVTWGLIADLLFFINSLRCPLSSSTSSMVALLERVRNSTQASSSTKIIKALKSASEPPPEPSLEVLVSQAGKDIIAEEKIKVLWERENSDRRGNPDRHRREHRAVS